jgi:hypothetical protein
MQAPSTVGHVLGVPVATADPVGFGRTVEVALGIDPATALVVFAAVALGGVVTGASGFGFAVVGTSLLVSVLGSRAAVTVMILPILAANVSLVGELDRDGLTACLRRFWPFLAAATVGTVAGMTLLSRIPTAPLTTSLGVLVLLYVGFAQTYVRVPGEAWLRDRCFVADDWAKAALGLVSGLVFGATNVGVQVVAYLRSLGLDRSTFVGVVAGVFLGVSSVRLVAALTLGLFDGSGASLPLSAAATVPGLAGVAVGRRLRRRLPDAAVTAATFALLALVGIRLVTSGLGL